jgi:hypothetical protein
MHSGMLHELDFDRDGKALSFLGLPCTMCEAGECLIRVA